MSRFRCFLYLVATLIGGVFVLVYRGPYWPIVRSYMGDWLIVQAIYLVGRLWIGFPRRYLLAGAVLLLGIATEIVQFVSRGGIPQTFLMEVTIGSTFDPLDIAAYALGLVTVLLVDWWQARRFLGDRYLR
jgi:hypothetical protein